MTVDKHFKRKARIMPLILPAIIILAVLAGILVPKILRWVDVDRCLDKGGSFDYGNSRCIGERDN